MVSKRPKLSYRAAAASTNPVRISGTCQVGDREAEDILVTDLSAVECQLRLTSIGLAKGEAFTLRLGKEAPIAGRLRWVRQDAVGVAFDVPLDEAVVERLLALAPPSNVVALRRGEAG